MTAPGIYVYGLVADGELVGVPSLQGVDGSGALEYLREGSVGALVSEVRLDQFDEQPLREHLADMAWVEQTARRHQQVLDAVLDQCTPLPMRLCTLYSDEQGLRQMLDRRQEDLLAALSELRGKLEWGVQAFAGARAGQAPPVATGVGANADLEAGSGALSGTAYLQQRLAGRRATEQADADLSRICERLHADLCTIALAGHLGMPQRADSSPRANPMIFNASYLVANVQSEAFAARVGGHDEEHGLQGLELRLTGPWPPYNFVTVPAEDGA